MTDLGEIKTETSFYLRELRDVMQDYNPTETEEKLEDKFAFMKKTIEKHLDEKEYLVPYLCDMGKNGGQKSLLIFSTLFM